MANTLKIKRGAAANIPTGQLAEPLFTSDTYDLYIGTGASNQRFQKYIASGTSSQFLKGDGSLDSTTYQATSEKGQNNGYASLDAGGKIPAAQLPSSVIEYKGTWNASTNTPTLADGTGDAGDVYIVSVGGTQNLGSGNITFDAGDWVMYNGSVWQKSTGSNAVASVNGQTGIVVLDTDDISEPVSPTNKWFTDARARAALSLTTTGTSGAATYDNSTGVFNIPQYQAVLTNPVTGTGTNNEIAYFNTTGSTIASLSTATYPSLTELSYVKGVTSAIQTQLNGKQNTLTNPVTGTGTTNTLPKFTGTSAIGNSNITDSGTLISLGSNTTITNGILTIGSTSLTAYTLLASKNITGSINAYGIVSNGVSQSDVTNTCTNFLSVGNTEVASFTLTNLYHFRATQGTFGAGSSVTNQFGFIVFPTLIGGSANFGFYGDIPSGTNRWNLYMNGTANNYLAGSLGIGSTSLTGYTLRLAKTLTGSVSATAIQSGGAIQSDVTSDAQYFSSAASTAAASFTITDLAHYIANQGTFGAGSTVTKQYGFRVAASLIGATNNYAFFSDLASGANRWNLYMNGTAANYLAGDTSIGTTTGGYKLNVSGTTNLNGALTGTSATFSSSAATSTVDIRVPVESPATGKVALSIGTSNGANDILRWFDGTTQLGVIKNSGNVGIGTTSPSTPLNVVSTYSAGATTTSLKLATVGGYNSGSGTSLDFGQDQGTYSTWLTGRISSPRTGSNWGGSLAFFTNDDSSATALVERMRITSGGNVGIGTTSPASLLSIQRGSSGDNMEFIGSGASGYSDILFYNTSKVARLGYIDWSDTQMRINVEANIPMVLYTNATERMRITSGGNVGIGTSSPLSFANTLTLHMNGGSSGSFFTMAGSGTRYLTILAQSGEGKIETNTAIPLKFATQEIERMRITSAGEVWMGYTTDQGSYLLQVNGNTLTNGSITTAAPSGGTAKPWKLGARLSGTVSTSTTNYLEVEIDGTLYYLAFAVPL